MKKLSKANVAHYASTALAALATIIATPLSASLVHQPKVPKELLKK
ncbi:AgrD family cyclic lactone autoinducer peptide [Brevibacillus brevis]|nr:cyclic lactone autoinducer peptide [Brevibacillus brevis]